MIVTKGSVRVISPGDYWYKQLYNGRGKVRDVSTFQQLYDIKFYPLRLHLAILSKNRYIKIHQNEVLLNEIIGKLT